MYMVAVSEEKKAWRKLQKKKEALSFVLYLEDKIDLQLAMALLLFAYFLIYMHIKVK